MSQIVYPFGDATVTLTAGQSIAVATIAEAQVFQLVGFPNFPYQQDLLGTPSGNTITVYGPFASGATIQFSAGATILLYNAGTDPTIPELTGVRASTAAVALNTTGAATDAAMIGAILDGVITSTTAAAVSLVLPTGATLDAALQLNVGDAIRWSVVNTGATNAATVSSAGSGNTLVGAGGVAATTSGSFVTIKTAAATFVTYRM